MGVARRRAAADPGPAFAEFFRAVYPRLARGLLLLTGDPGEAEELAQEALARAFERWDRVGGMESPEGYVYRTALNLNRKRLRGLAVRARRLLGVGAPADPADEAVARADVRRAMAGVPRPSREALVLVTWLGLSTEEAGRILGIGAASVRSRLHRGRAALRERLGARDG